MNKKIDYEALVQKALRGVIKQVLKDVARHGLPGKHHFLITFASQYQGVVIPQYVLEEHPDEITIILQHEFENLKVFDDCFKISLVFDDRLEDLTIPYESIICFVDPHTKFGLHFDEQDIQDVADLSEASTKDNVVSLDAFRKDKF